jgi:hypothetical protein
LARREGRPGSFGGQHGEVDRLTAQLSRAIAAAFPHKQRCRERRSRPAVQLLVVQLGSEWDIARRPGDDCLSSRSSGLELSSSAAAGAASFAGQTATRSFVAAWRRAFGSDPPNAALRVLRRDTGRDVALELLGRPRYNARTATLTYRIRRLDDADAGLFPSRFKDASLFIDSAPDTDTTAGTTGPRSIRS